MRQVFGDEDTVRRAESAKPGDPAVYINMDAISQLPDQYEAQISKVAFTIKDDFSDVGNGNLMPTPELHAKIALARGIEGTDQAHFEPIIEEVDVNTMLCRDITDEPTMRRMKVGYVATKTGFVLEEDGNEHESDPCTASYNVLERCAIDWAKEEEATSGYDPSIVKDGPYNAFDKQFNGPHYVKGNYSYGLRYATPWARKRHFAEEMKFAQRKADTKARHIVIRVLAGLKTGYKAADLKDGFFLFAKIRRSRESLQLEQAARLKAISEGALPNSRAGQQLFGPPTETTLTIHEAPDEGDIPFDDVPWEVDPQLSIIDVIEAYRDGDLIADAKLKANATRAIKTLRESDGFDKTHESWGNARALLKRVESGLEAPQIIDHKDFSI